MFDGVKHFLIMKGGYRILGVDRSCPTGRTSKVEVEVEGTLSNVEVGVGIGEERLIADVFGESSEEVGR